MESQQCVYWLQVQMPWLNGTELYLKLLLDLHSIYLHKDHYANKIQYILLLETSRLFMVII